MINNVIVKRKHGPPSRGVTYITLQLYTRNLFCESLLSEYHDVMDGKCCFMLKPYTINIA